MSSEGKTKLTLASFNKACLGLWQAASIKKGYFALLSSSLSCIISSG